MTFIISIILAFIALASIGIKRAYEHTTVKQLKKRAREGDVAAELLHRAAVYGPSLRFVLWVIVVITTTLFFLFTARSTEVWFATFMVAGLLWFGFIWLPHREVSNFGIWTATKIAPALAWLASAVHPVVSTVSGRVRGLFPVHVHSGLYDEDDFVKLLQQQKQQADNVIPESSMEIAAHAITYGNVLVRDVLVPRRAVHMVQAEDSIGPVFMDELHKSGFSRFPVYGDKKDQIVGILFMRDLVKTTSSKTVKSVMKKRVLYIHEEQTLQDALQAILKTKHHLFIVVNSFEEYVGILTIEDVFERILGKQVVDEFDRYDDMRAVAASAAADEHKQNEHPSE
jgi:CBS domain containing-hemolysin-like protein